MTISIAFSALALAGFGTQATAGPEAGSVNACKLLASVIQQDAHWQARLPLHRFDQFGTSWRCEFTSKPIEGTVHFKWMVLLYFFDGHSAAVAHQNYAALLKGAKTKGANPVAPRAFGIDEGFALQQGAGGLVGWRKGRYTGYLSAQGPPPFGLLGIHDLFLNLMRRVPRS